MTDITEAELAEWEAAVMRWTTMGKNHPTLRLIAAVREARTKREAFRTKSEDELILLVKIREERDQLRAKLAEIRSIWGDFNPNNWPFPYAVTDDIHNRLVSLHEVIGE
jgi:hypothetical protein